MLSWGVYVWATDRHSVFDQNSKVLLNAGHNVTIGSHVWVGMHALILKNSYIADNCIVGAQAVVSKKFEEPGCVLAGNPAKVVKRGINWSPVRPKEYVVPR